jgi:hypothetical protein
MTNVPDLAALHIYADRLVSTHYLSTFPPDRIDEVKASIYKILAKQVSKDLVPLVRPSELVNGVIICELDFFALTPEQYWQLVRNQK